MGEYVEKWEFQGNSLCWLIIMYVLIWKN